MADLTTATGTHEFIAGLDEVDLARFRVVGSYTRYDEAVRNALQDARQQIIAGFEPPGRKRENHLIWAAPGTGKTYFVQQVAASLPRAVRYHELNLTKCTEPEFRAGLGALNDREACLCLVDEIDAKPQEPWPYEVLLPYLDAAVERGARFVFVLAGSSGTSIHDIKQRIAARPKGTDLLSRVPAGQEYEIGSMNVGDRVLIVLSQLRQAGQEAGREIRAVEKLGLYYVALNPRLANARQLREFAVRAVERVPKSDDRVKYDHLFTPGDPENKAFWVKAQPAAEGLVNTFVVLTEDRVRATPSRMSESTRLPAGTASAPSGAEIEARPRTNLPRQLTSFIGRERDVAEVKRLLPTTGLLTLNGAGGCGKTRLAFRVVADLVAQYPDGVWVAQLAALSDPALVPKAVATALNVHEEPNRSLVETLEDFLRPKSLLLVLDNCEHLVNVCAELTDVLLRSCPTLRILATSREPLGIAGEILWRVPSLSVPDPMRRPSPESLVESEAVRLFLERAANAEPGFAITGGNATAIAHVCSQLDGIPLAIELAAARVKVLTVEQIAARLDDRFRLLTGGGRTALPRHQTLRATMDWSYGLLSEKEQTVLRRLSVFAGGCSLEAAETVCSGDGVVAAADILDLLTQLVDKSLVVTETQGGEARYRLLETVRQYGRARLEEAGEAADVRRRHRDWYLALAEQAAPELLGLGMGRQAYVYLERLATEHDNLRGALECSKTEPGGGEAELRLAGALWRFWFERGQWREGRGWLETSLARAGDVQTQALLNVLRGAAWLAWHQRDHERAAALGEKGLALSRVLGNKEGIAWSLHILGLAAWRKADYARATALFEDSLALGRELGNKWWVSTELIQLGVIARAQRDDDRAGALYGDALALARETGERRQIAYSLQKFGLLALDQGDHARAAQFYSESLALLREMRDRGFITLDCLEGLASVAYHQGYFEKAASLFGAADAFRESLHRPRYSGEGKYERGVASARAALGKSAFAAAWAAGRAMTLEQASECALAGGHDQT